MTTLNPNFSSFSALSSKAGRGAEKWPAIAGFVGVLLAFAVAFACVALIGVSMVKLIRMSTTTPTNETTGTFMSFNDGHRAN